MRRISTRYLSIIPNRFMCLLPKRHLRTRGSRSQDLYNQVIPHPTPLLGDIEKSCRLQYLSDLHLEYKTKVPRIQVRGNYLALLGDIGNPYHSNYRDLLYQVSDKFEKVFMISGNHEYWNNDSMDATDNQIIDVTSRFTNVYFLNNTSYQLDSFTLLGTTLWSKINRSNRDQNNRCGDHANIRYRDINITVDDINSLHDKAVRWLKSEISKCEKAIVLSHHLPSYQLIVPKYQKPRYWRVKDRFASHLDYLIKPPVMAWLCGHSHCKVEMKINGVYCGINVEFHK